MAGYQSCIGKQIADNRESGSKYHNLSEKMQNFMSGDRVLVYGTMGINYETHSLIINIIEESNNYYRLKHITLKFI